MICLKHFKGPSLQFVVVVNFREPINLAVGLCCSPILYSSVNTRRKGRLVLFIEERHTRDFKGRAAREAHPSEIKGMFLFFLPSLEHTPLHNSNNPSTCAHYHSN